ncbi:CopD family protein [Novosphingobium sp. RL4]|uniref:CopD family protein n=1 Tax=Novosphingobium sp. RL4 TaxID=3109595 RepID=UPI002D782A07|nr:CopD family protein [Novosphingobium sp. RL4]WRT96079.1 CopD family protein [Novosphingobium sp. RL4]
METGSLVAARLASYVLLLAAAGLPFHALIQRRARFGGGERAALMLLAAGALITSLWWALANVAAMAGLAIGDLDTATFTAVLQATPLGLLLTLRAAALTAFLVLLALRPAPLLLAPLALAALASAAWAGHAGAGEAPWGVLLRASDVLHLGAAALWLGALFAFLTAPMGRGRRKDTAVIAALSAFARTGTVIVAMLFLTGLANAWLIGGAGGLPSGWWPRLIALKFALFLAMLALAADNRWRLVPALERRTPGAARRLRLSLMLETACGLGIVGVVALAGQLDPHGG